MKRLKLKKLRFKPLLLSAALLTSTSTFADSRSDIICSDRTMTEPNLSLECLQAALDDRSIRGALWTPSKVAALRDGRLDISLITRRLKSLDMVGRQTGETDESIHELSHAAPLTPEELDLLRRGTAVDAKPGVLGPQGLMALEGILPPPPDPFPVPPPQWAPTPENPNYLNIGQFLDDFHAAISPNVNGYALRMRRDGQTVGVLQWNWARQPGDFPPIPWNSNDRMHVASISKFMSAIGLYHLLLDEGIDTDSPIISYLPDYWNISQFDNIHLITFEDLMNHTSGFSTGGSSSTWATMQANVEAGVSAANVGSSFDYENMNFGLIRILIATIGGYINPAANFGTEQMNDAMWDLLTYSSYDHYMQTHIFNPVGASPTLDRNLLTTLAYRFDGSGTAWNSGDFSGSAGGVGWHMTINEILDVVRALRSGQYFSGLNAQILLNNSWGLNSPVNGDTTDAGRTFYKAGLWRDSAVSPTTRTEQCFVFMMPDNMELAVFVNSQITPTSTSLTNLVRNTYDSNIVIVAP